VGGAAGVSGADSPGGAAGTLTTRSDGPGSNGIFASGAGGGAGGGGALAGAGRSAGSGVDGVVEIVGLLTQSGSGVSV
jgi:hypothetical protein